MKRISYARGKGKLRHNNREMISPNVDKARIKDNIELKRQSLADAYEEIFGDAVAEYNAKQRRSDRKISDYFENLSQAPRQLLFGILSLFDMHPRRL